MDDIHVYYSQHGCKICHLLPASDLQTDINASLPAFFGRKFVHYQSEKLHKLNQLVVNEVSSELLQNPAI